METQDTFTLWSAFRELNGRRRAIRDFDGTAIPDAHVRELLAEAARAPSSGNLQPYQLHWIRDPAVKARAAVVCNRQRAAATAPTLIVVTASREVALDTATQQLAHVNASADLPEPSKDYYRQQARKMLRILSIGSWPVWSPLAGLLGLFKPSLSLLPVGHMGNRSWAARNAAFAAQTLMLAAAARGIDSCPMEGFSAPKLAEVLALPRGTVIPLVIALGYRSQDARIEQQWRKSLTDLIVEH